MCITVRATAGSHRCPLRSRRVLEQIRNHRGRQVWGRLSICGRLVIGLFDFARLARRIANQPDPEGAPSIPPHIITVVAVGPTRLNLSFGPGAQAFAVGGCKFQGNRYPGVPSVASSDGAPSSSQSLNSPNAWARRHSSKTALAMAKAGPASSGALQLKG